MEAFTLRGLGRLAESWKTNPPFPGDNQFRDGMEIRQNITRLQGACGGGGTQHGPSGLVCKSPEEKRSPQPQPVCPGCLLDDSCRV